MEEVLGVSEFSQTVRNEDVFGSAGKRKPIV